jgi:hypothetical protein
MLRRCLPCLCLVLLCASASFAQARDYPKWDFTAAFTLNNFETPPPATRHNFKGFTAAIAGNFRRWAAVEGDFTYTRGSINGVNRSLFTYLIGPRFTKRFTPGGSGAPTRHNHPGPGVTKPSKMALEPFAHVLIGGGHLNGFLIGPIAGNNSSNGWAGKFGGGLDIVAGKHIAIRVIQIDYYRYHGHIPNAFTRQRLDNVAFTFGVRLF